jgi:hypothetical protein
MAKKWYSIGDKDKEEMNEANLHDDGKKYFF